MCISTDELEKAKQKFFEKTTGEKMETYNIEVKQKPIMVYFHLHIPRYKHEFGWREEHIITIQLPFVPFVGMEIQPCVIPDGPIFKVKRVVLAIDALQDDTRADKWDVYLSLD